MKSFLRLALAVLFMVATATVAPAQDQKVRVLIVTGKADLPYHVWQDTTASMRKILEASGRFDLRVTEEPRGLSSEALENYDVLVLNYNGPRWPGRAEKAVEEFVHSGGGFVAVHQASYGEFFGHVFQDGRWQMGEPGEEWKAFSEIIGARWKPENIGHARRTVFTVDWADRNHPVSSGLGPSFVANDELYHKLELDSDVHILAEAMSPADLGGTGQVEPLAWTHRYGEGRVFFTPLGHDSLAWYEPGMANLFARGVEWAATGAVTLDPATRTGRFSRAKPIRLLAVTGGHDYPVEFYSMLESLPGVRWEHATSHEEAFRNPIRDSFDVLLLHDMYDTTSERTRERLKGFVEGGGGVVSIHHAVVDYTDWPWWYQEVVGGKYFVKAVDGHGASSYEHDVEFFVEAVEGKRNHPVLKGVGPLWVNDEAYKNMYHSEKIEVLMETSQPKNDRPVVYVGPWQKSRVVYVQLGHSADTMRNPGFQRLVSNAVHWVAAKSE